MEALGKADKSSKVVDIHQLVSFLRGELTIGAIVFIYTIYGNVVGPLFGFVHGLRMYYRSMIDFQDLFEYGKIERSQNRLEEEFLTTLSSQFPKEIKMVEIADRGYGKSILLKNRLKRQELFIIRGRRDVGINYEENKKTYRKSLGRLKHSLGKPRRYRNCLYQGKKR